jgi:hypothetical protein
MECFDCGTSGLKADAKYCFHCGRSTRKKCTDCDADLVPGAGYCSDCGLEQRQLLSKLKKQKMNEFFDEESSDDDIKPVTIVKKPQMATDMPIMSVDESKHNKGQCRKCRSTTQFGTTDTPLHGSASSCGSEVCKAAIKKIDNYNRKSPPPKFTARMFHPYNGRDNFETTASSKDLLHAKVRMTPLLLAEMETWKANNPRASIDQLEEHFGITD